LGPSSLPNQDRAEVLQFQQRAGELQRAVSGSAGRLQESLDQMDAINGALRRAQKETGRLLQEARSIELKLLDLRDRLGGDKTLSDLSVSGPVSIVRRATLAYEGSLNSTYGPTETHRQAYAIAAEEYRELRQELATAIEKDLAGLKKKLDAARVPWTAGRPIPQWEEE
jgi:hypothetical protein